MQFFRDLIYSIRATSIVDILIMACIIYFVLAWLKKTRAVRILVTLLGIGLLYVAASYLGLVLTSVLFQYLWATIIIVLVIVFQPEIREMLERASPIRYLSGGLGSVVEPSTIDEVVKAVSELARNRTGALMVFRRLDRLGNLVLKGSVLDCLVTSETLITIFQKGTPLHDGAVLVSNDRVEAAACILPLSTDENLSSRYGTRHRAALGLTERCDALCVVVSEERGEVSLVQGNKISNFKKKQDFRQSLERGLIHGSIQDKAVSPRVIEMFTANWGLKILSIVTAIMIWFVFVGPQKSELGINVPIQYTGLPAGMEIKAKWMDRLDVRIRGSEPGLARVNEGSV
ncbi:diadenylate cyclase CdaA, partial [Thermodesulfobacteriota bacterium]